MECHQRDWLLTTPLVQQEAHEVLDRKFALVLQARALFDAIWSEAQCVADVAEPADDNDARLVSAALAAGADVFVTGDRRVLGLGGAAGDADFESARRVDAVVCTKQPGLGSA